MPYIALNPERYITADKIIGTGQCVALVEQAANAPFTKYWKQGAKVRGNLMLQKGIAIATFQNGSYANSTSGYSHAAIYLGQDKMGIWVIDQWKKNINNVHKPAKRQIRFKNGVGFPNNDGDAYYVIEKEDKE